MRLRQRRNVDLPQPEGLIIARTSLLPMSRLTCSIPILSPYITPTFREVMRGFSTVTSPTVSMSSGIGSTCAGSAATGSGGGVEEDFDPGVRQVGVDLSPLRVRVGDEGLAAVQVRHVLGEREEDLLAGVPNWIGFPGVREHDAVVADLDLDDLVHPVAGALVDLALLDAPQGVGDVRVLTPTPAQNSLRLPPEPVDSIFGVLKAVVLPNCSATTVANG